MNNNDGWDDFLDAFIKKGESLPMERHGQAGTIYRPFTILNEAELILLCDFENAGMATSRDMVDRNEGIELLEKVARKTVKNETLRATMIKNVMAYIDKLFMLRKTTNQKQS